jgi:hypothetical protein
MGAKLERGVQRALRDQADRARDAIVEGLQRQAPGGHPLAPLSASTLATRALKGRASDRVLIERGELVRAVAKVVQRERAFVGIRNSARGRSGRSLATIAQVHELGAMIRIRITPAMRRLLFAVSRVQGGPASRARPSSGFVVVRIPARQFLRPAFALATRDARPRVVSALARALGWR